MIHSHHFYILYVPPSLYHFCSSYLLLSWLYFISPVFLQLVYILFNFYSFSGDLKIPTCVLCVFNLYLLPTSLKTSAPPNSFSTSLLLTVRDLTIHFDPIRHYCFKQPILTWMYQYIYHFFVLNYFLHTKPSTWDQFSSFWLLEHFSQVLLVIKYGFLNLKYLFHL